MSSVNRDYQEKRSFIRMRIDTPAKIEVHQQDEIYQGVCKDLSGGGMLIELNTAIPVGTELQVHIESDHGHSPMLQARTRVSRIVSQPGEASSPCLLGLEVIEMLN